jgi:hypothetical protein
MGDTSLGGLFSPPNPGVHPVVAAAQAAAPPTQAAAPKMIGGHAYAGTDAQGNPTLGGVKVSRETLQFYVDRQTKLLAGNMKTPMGNSPALKPLMDDMQAQITNAQAILDKAK